MHRAILILAVLFWVPSLFAHHGAGSFDLSKTVSFTDVVLTRADLINPHAWLYFDVVKEGRSERHRCEMRSMHVLRRSGWTNEMFPIGQRVNIVASPDKYDPNSCYLQTVLFLDGSRMDRYGQYIKAPEGGLREVRGPLVTPDKRRAYRRPSGEPDISGDWAPEQVVMADPRGVGGGMTPLSQLGQYKPGERPAAGARRGGGQTAGPRLYGGAELTEAGEKAAAGFERSDNPRFRCETTSIIFDWTFDGPVNRITQNKDTIVLQYGQFGLRRTIDMNMKQHPANIKPSRAGHSIGYWEGDVLVVDTAGFLPGVLNAPVLHSDKLHVVERFSLDPKTFALTRSYAADDQVFLKGKYTGSDVIQVADAPYSPERCQDLGSVDYSKQGEQKR